MHMHTSAERSFVCVCSSTRTRITKTFLFLLLVMQKMRHSHSGMHRRTVPPLGIFAINLVYIWGCVHTHTHIIIMETIICLFFPPFYLKKKYIHVFFPLQFNFPSSLLFAFHSCDRQLGFPLSHSHTLSHASFFSLSLSLILWLFAEVSQSLGEPRGTAESAVPAPSQGGIEG